MSCKDRSTIPPEYQGREQSLLKHRVLEEYLRSWAQKLGSTARYRKVRLYYVDCFAGPWQAKDQELSDTSCAIGLTALEEAVQRWSSRGTVEVVAVFVEQDAASYKRLVRFLSSRSGRVKTTAINGMFGDQVARIDEMIGDGSAFFFIDPTGWKGVAMESIAPLARKPRRDVLINVMFNDMNRFKDDPRTFLRAQMRDFFGLKEEDIPPGLDEKRLFEFYRSQLRKHCDLKYVADLAIPHPTQNRTWFHLVVGGHHNKVLELFRRIEKKVCGSEAGEIRAAVRQRGKDQLSLSFKQADPRFEQLRNQDLEDAKATLLSWPTGAVRFEVVWEKILAEFHVTRTDAARMVLELCAEGEVAVITDRKHPRTLRDDQIINWK